MGEVIKEQEFLDFFDAHVDALFSYCVDRIGDRARARELVERTFIRAWDQVVSGRDVKIREFYRILDQHIDSNLGIRNPALAGFFGNVTQRMKVPS